MFCKDFITSFPTFPVAPVIKTFVILKGPLEFVMSPLALAIKPYLDAAVLLRLSLTNLFPY
jgi:hypothetical protein